MSSEKADVSSSQGDSGDAEKKDGSNGSSGEEKAGNVRERPIRHANPRDFVRIFTDYATKKDIVLIIIGIASAILTGIVRSIPAAGFRMRFPLV